MQLKYFYFFLIVPLFMHSQKDKVLQELSPSKHFVYDIRYASENNFLEEAFYDCPVCYLRPEVVHALQAAAAYFYDKGFKVVLYDCYRPVEAQIKMWKNFPNPHYVANPYTKGSVHSRGAAVDLSLLELNGTPVNMGTDHDHFGREAHIDHDDFPENILKSRAVLQEGMRKFGFKTIRTEWWHFDYKNGYSLPILNSELPCK